MLLSLDPFSSAILNETLWWRVVATSVCEAARGFWVIYRHNKDAYVGNYALTVSDLRTQDGKFSVCV